MKRVLTLAIGIAMSIAIAQAQTDTSRTKTKPTQTPTNRQDTSRNQSNQYRSHSTKDMVRVNQSDIPASLRTTLQGSEYKGWEKGTLYHNPKTNEYLLQFTPQSGTSASGSAGSQQSYRFDSQGKRIPDSQRDNK